MESSSVIAPLHPQDSRLTKYGLLLFVLALSIRSQHRAEVVIVDLLLVCHQELPPPLLASLALHLVLVNLRCRVELGEIGLQMCIDLIVELCESECRSADLLEDGPVCGHMLDD